MRGGVSCQDGALKEDEMKCVDSCVEGAIKGERPNYNFLNISVLGQNCHGWANSTLRSCVKQCRGNK